MAQFFFRQILFALFLFPLSAMEVSPAEAEIIGRGIFLNECSGKKERLVWWNEGENFASLGIGHFIWCPKGISLPFEETFPSFLTFLKEQKVEIPGWLKGEEGCPWLTKEEFSDRSQEAKKNELQGLLSRTIGLQTAFIVKRFEKALEEILASMSEEKRKHALQHIERLEKSVQGKFALIDYLNFKGSGVLASERYHGKGWGLRQVLEEMPFPDENPLQTFSETAKTLLDQRIRNAPPQRHEERWLRGWLSRVDRYTGLLKVVGHEN